MPSPDHARDTAFDPTANTVGQAFDAYADAHAQGCPIAHSDAHGGFWLVVGNEAARGVLTDHERFLSSGGVMFPDPGLPKNIPLEFDPPEHTGLRKIFSDALSTPKVRATGERITQRIDTLIDSFIECGSADLKNQYAGPLTVQTIAEQIGVPDERLPDMERVAHNLLQALDQPATADPEVFGEFSAFAMELIQERRTTPQDDTLTVLAQARVDGRELGAQEAVGYFTGFLIAGHDTTRASLTRLLYYIGRDDSLKQRLIDNPELIPRAVEESLRLRPPFHFFRRTVAVETELDGQLLSPGDAVLVSFAGANRDPSIFDEPDKFIPDRPEWRHLTFGQGIHLCAGATLARTQLRLAVARVLERLPDYHPTIIDTDTDRLHLVDSMDILPVEFTPGLPCNR